MRNQVENQLQKHSLISRLGRSFQIRNTKNTRPHSRHIDHIEKKIEGYENICTLHVNQYSLMHVPSYFTNKRYILSNFNH